MRRPQSLRQPVRRHAASALRIIAGSAYIPPDYVALFERVKRSIKGSSRESRTEAFLRYVEENPGELLAALDDDSERMVRELEMQRDRAERALRDVPPSKRQRSTPEELAAVPF